MAGDTIQTARFGWLHAARDAGASGVTINETVTATSAESRLYDGMARRLVTWSAAGTKSIDVNRGVTPREPITRLVIPTGHNIAGHRLVFRESTTGAFAGEEAVVLPYTALGGSSIYKVDPTVHGGINVFDFPEIGSRYVRVYIDKGPTTNVPAIGELWWTRMHAPTFGFDPAKFKRSHKENNDRQTLSSGVTLSYERGPLRRQWNMQTTPVYGADRRLYTTMLNELGGGRDLLIVDPPESGYETVLDDGSDHTTWTSVAGVSTKANGATYYTTGTAAPEMVGTGLADLVVSRTLSSTIDARRKIIGLDVRVSTTGWMGADTGVSLLLYTGSGYCQVNVGTNLFRSVNSFYTVWFDVDSDSEGVSGEGLDPKSLDKVGLYCISGANALTISVDNLRVIDKDKEPMICRLVNEPEEAQALSYIGNGAQYELDLEFLEAIE